MNLSNSSHPGNIFTCNSCLIQFVSSDMQRYHMKSEWHRYNLHRKINHLSPVTGEEFIEKSKLAEQARARQLQVDENGFEILEPIQHFKKRQARTSRPLTKDDSVDEETDSETEGSAERSSSPTHSLNSKVSNLTVGGDFTTDYDEETGSEFGDTTDSGFEATTDDDRLGSSDEDSDSEADDYVNVSEYNLTDCIFCGAHNKEIELNVRHMFNKHGLYIPERTYLADLEGLLDFLNLIVIDEHHCLSCTFQGTSLESIRNHMDSKRHAKLPYETAREKALFEEFYDFSLKEEINESRLEASTAKKVSFETEIDNDTKSSKSQKQREEINNKNKELAKQKHERREKALAAVPSYDRRNVNGLTSKELQKVEKRAQRLEKLAQHRGITDNRFKRANYQKHFRDTLLGVL